MESRESGHRLIGQVFDTGQYGKAIVVNYFNNKHVVVEFLNTGTLCSVRLNNLRKGRIADAFATHRSKLIYGHGVVGVGKYRKRTHKKAYDRWLSMLSRCYNPAMHIREPAYADCTVCDEWLNFQSFATWHYKQIDGEGFSLDKDILVKGNKQYGPEYCALIPKQINNLFEKRFAKRGPYPIGVYRSGQCTNNPYVARCKDYNGKTKHLGCFPSAREAFVAYKTFKEKIIKEKAEYFKDVIDPRVYDAMIKYEVEITD